MRWSSLAVENKQILEVQFKRMADMQVDLDRLLKYMKEKK